MKKFVLSVVILSGISANQAIVTNGSGTLSFATAGITTGKAIAMAIVLEEVDGENIWNVFLINLHIVPIKNVIVSSRGYGEINGEMKRTSTLRHFFEEIPDLEFTRVEPIMENTFGLTNEFWVSFYIDGKIYDKQYIFLPETINEKNFTKIPLLNVEGVMIR